MELVDLVIEGGIATVTFTNPPKGFMTSDMVVQLDSALDAIEGDESARVVVFTGGLPGVFIRHFSIEEIISMSDALKSQRDSGAVRPRFSRSALRLVWERVDNFPKPTIAAINGTCGGGGCELTLCCDIRLAGPGDYTIGQMEILVGIMPGAGGTARLARAVGFSKALEWTLRGRMFSPVEAAEEGLVHHYIDGDVLEAARQIAGEFLDKPAAALAYIKRVMRSSHGKALQDGIDEEGDLFAALILEDEQALRMMREYVDADHKIGSLGESSS